MIDGQRIDNRGQVDVREWFLDERYVEEDRRVGAALQIQRDQLGDLVEIEPDAPPILAQERTDGLRRLQRPPAHNGTEPRICVVRTGTSRTKTRSSAGAGVAAMRSSRHEPRALLRRDGVGEEQVGAFDREVAVLRRCEVRASQRSGQFVVKGKEGIFLTPVLDHEVSGEGGQHVEPFRCRALE